MSFINTIHRLLSGKLKPVFYGLAAGLYPVFFYYSNNFTLVNSTKHFIFFTTVFILLPIISFWIIYKLFSIHSLIKWRENILSFLTVFVFLLFMKLCLFAGTKLKITLAIFLFSIILGTFLSKHIKRIVVFQLLLAIIGFLTLLTVMIRHFSHESTWKEQPDNIASVILKKKPNIYFIQPDGYVNPSELQKGFYQIKNNEFENFLASNNFKTYNNFRNNYSATLPSNSAIFTMKHHYYNGGKNDDEALQAREIIMGDNTVLDILVSNGYKTFFLTESPYLLLNFPKTKYDFTNFPPSTIPFITKGTHFNKDVLKELKNQIHLNSQTTNFFFIQLFNPGHINGDKSLKNAASVKREKYISSLKVANQKLTQLVKTIKKNDSSAIILLMSDHGGYVGLEYSQQTAVKTQNRDIIYSIFSSLLAIDWNGNLPEGFDAHLNTSVNVFRVLFASLSNDTSYLSHLQEDASYIILKKGIKEGVYKYINSKGNIVLEKIK